jgi:hypothetical protein
VAPACAGTCWTCPASCLPAACSLRAVLSPACLQLPAALLGVLNPPPSTSVPSPAAEGRSITDVEGMRAAAEELHHYGPQASALSVALLPVAAR